MDDVYQPPQSDLTGDDNEIIGEYGSIEKAIVGDYELNFNDVLNEAWCLTKGVKWKLFCAFFLLIIISINVLIGLVTVVTTMDGHVSVVVAVIASIIFTGLLYPMWTGIMVMGIDHSVGKNISFTYIFKYIDKLIPVVVAGFFMSILTQLGYFLLLLPGIYLFISYMFALPLVCEKDLSPWQALETSRKAIHHNWFSFAGIIFAMGLITMLSGVLLFGIGLIWTIPMTILVIGIMYRNMFGVEPE